MWLSDPHLALVTVTLLEIWNWTPFTFIIMLAGLSAIPKEPIEAAQILGASRGGFSGGAAAAAAAGDIVGAGAPFLEAMASFR